MIEPEAAADLAQEILGEFAAQGSTKAAELLGQTPPPRTVPATVSIAAVPATVLPPAPPDAKVDFRDVMPSQELPAPDVPSDPTLVELIARGLKEDGRRTTDYSHLLKR